MLPVRLKGPAGLRMENGMTTATLAAHLDESSLAKLIDVLWDRRTEISSATRGPDREAVDEALALLESGAARVAEPGNAGWQVNQWLKKAVLLSFRLYDSAPMPGAGGAPVFDKVPMKFEGWGENRFAEAGFRAVPGAVVRRSAFIGRNVVLMPSFVNVGVYVAEATKIYTRKIVGSTLELLVVEPLHRGRRREGVLVGHRPVALHLPGLLVLVQPDLVLVLRGHTWRLVTVGTADGSAASSSCPVLETGTLGVQLALGAHTVDTSWSNTSECAAVSKCG